MAFKCGGTELASESFNFRSVPSLSSLLSILASRDTCFAPREPPPCILCNVKSDFLTILKSAQPVVFTCGVRLSPAEKGTSCHTRIKIRRPLPAMTSTRQALLYFSTNTKSCRMEAKKKKPRKRRRKLSELRILGNHIAVERKLRK